MVDEVSRLKVRVQQGAEPGDYDRVPAKATESAAHGQKLSDVERAHASELTLKTTEITQLTKQLTREVNKRIAEA